MSEINNNNSTVGIIITTYNRADLLPRAIGSVLEQTYQDFRIVIIDDSSTDNTEEVVRNFADNRIGYLRHGENGGCAKARNSGLNYFSESVNYVCFLDSDDCFRPEKLSKEVALFESNPNAAFLYSDYMLCDEVSGKKGLRKVAAANKPENFSREHFLTNEAKSCGMMYRSSLLKKHRFREDLRYNEDSEFLQRIAIEEKGIYSDYPGCIVYFHPGSKSKNTLDISLAVYESCLNILRDYPQFSQEMKDKTSGHLKRLRSSIFKHSVLNGLWGQAKDYAQDPFQRFILRHHLSLYYETRDRAVLIIKKLFFR